MPPRLRKAALMIHIASSVGWIGAVMAFLALAITGYGTADEWTMRAAYTTMEIIGWTALVPLSVLTLITGVLQGLGSQWGVIRHYWVLMKLLITAVSTAILLLYMNTLTLLAEAASRPTGGGASADLLPSFSPILHATAALIILLVALGLSIYKPRGVTSWGVSQARSGAGTKIDGGGR